MKQYITLSEEVRIAKEQGKPIVALESTIISHGMPYPQNVKTAREVEQIIRDNGAVPATIAIVDGKIKIGLSDEELEMFGKSSDVAKASRRDLAYLLATKKLGATTVAATMICAEAAGINIFVTGGIGGAHRGAETTMDISADLEELGQTNVAVICAGAKSILDLGLTMEYLETKGVPVIGYQTDVLPAFYTRNSEFSVNFRADDAETIASTLKVKWDLNLKGGAVIANPIPEEFAMDEKTITNVIEAALKEAEEKHISGKNVTPFLLGKVKELTDGKSLDANIALVKNNAVVGAQIAVSFNGMK
ncbi:pseudouridine-5'-phosphate glycosidase [Neobacillus sp. B4I6]|jgi:pseudouridylate synthase|uniref:pseudouridine-5'-phosphate glycosidase n=1 Tax=Bacillaceae TaxID=186817 RepID=UPI001BEC48A4|nr:MULTISPECIES: pseudouridine-5'-phosphate glycosidase [unclassified Bacillus (in: firmicutes)]MBT2699129.1 pseudouridine-5'-phosphate glycosidase [Bacillus sp. ISL-40]MBT2724877.1 pseudouridine-5'-phosphate glycosidase [Bacillus sp. ISL-46]MBT2739089.1 pseudouridine-5'-phosphate glycosidase [Bacillus sp. ISL-7]MBT2739416.1 pseudouridine-5'-phosphate glycosidase [Bacillus sp. ISL-77]